MVFTKLLRKALYSIIFVILVFITFTNIFSNYLHTPGPLNDKTIVLVRPGLSTSEISSLLAGIWCNQKSRIFLYHKQTIFII